MGAHNLSVMFTSSSNFQFHPKIIKHTSHPINKNLPLLKSKSILNYNETHQINYSKDDKSELKQAKERQKSTSVPSFY